MPSAVLVVRSHHSLIPPVNAAFTTATTGGTLAGSQTVYYRVTALSALGETTPSPETSQVIPAGTNTNTVTVNWGAVAGATGYRVYGRGTGTQQFLVTLGVVTTWVDTGSASPSGAMPTANTADDGGTAVSTIAYKTADDDATGAPKVIRPGAGSAYSWVKQLRLRVTTAPDTRVDNFKVYFTGTRPTGVTLSVLSSGIWLDVLANAATVLTGTTNADTYTAAAPLSLSGSATATGAAGDFVRLQLGVASTATVADGQACGSCIFRYDEQ